MAPIKSNNGVYNDNGQSNRNRVTPETQRQSYINHLCWDLLLYPVPIRGMSLYLYICLP